MSIYSCIQVVKNNGKTSIFLGAVDAASSGSKVFQTILKQDMFRNRFDFAPAGGSPLALPNEIAITSK